MTSYGAGLEGNSCSAGSANISRQAADDGALEVVDQHHRASMQCRWGWRGVCRGVGADLHDVDKESLLTAAAAESWERIGDDMHALRRRPGIE
jgi:hypothetical protein